MVRVLRNRSDPLPAWVEANVFLPTGTTAEPGPIRLFAYQRGIAATIRVLIALPSEIRPHRLQLLTHADA